MRTDWSGRLRIGLGLIFAIAIVAPASAQEFVKMDGTWTVTVNGQTVQVEPDGSFVIPNVSAPDQFGAGGPGTAPDFKSDDFLRVIGISTVDGVTRYAYSEQFRFEAGQQFSVGQMTITDTAPPFPQSIVATPDDLVLNTAGQTTVVQVIGTLLDGSELDVTGAAAGSTYRTSNPNILSVAADGTATAVSDGVAFITATNEGAASVARIVVSLGDPLTQVVGFVQREDGSSVEGAGVSVIGQGQTAMTLSDGSFSIPDVATALGPIRVSASTTEGMETLSGTSTEVDPVPAGLTDAGIVVVHVSDFRLLGSSSIQGPNPGSIFEIDVELGTATLIGTPDNTPEGISDLAFNPVTGELYAMHGAANRGAELLRLDPTTAEVLSRVEVTGSPLSGSDAMVFDDAGTLYVGLWQQGRLATVDPATGAILTDVPVSGSGGNNHLADLALDPTTGELWASRGNSSGGNNRLLILDPATGAATFLLTPNPLTIFTGIAFGSDGTLFGSMSGNQLAIIDKTTGFVTPIGPGFFGEKIAGLGARR